MLCAATFNACDDSSILTTRSTGRPYEVVVVNDCDGIVQDALTRQVTALPQREAMFDVTAVTHGGDDLSLCTARHARNIVTVSIDPKLWPKPKVMYERDTYARPQIIIHVGAPSAKALRTLLAGKGDGAYRGINTVGSLLTAQERACTEVELRKRGNRDMERRVKDMFGIDMHIPRDMKAHMEGKDFIWISDDKPGFMRNICVYTSENRDSVMKANIKGETDSMFMATNKASLATYACRTDNGTATVTRGLWEMRGGSMGGPFVSYAYRDTGRRRTVVVETFVFAPGRNKRTAIMQDEAAVATVTFSQDK